MPGIGGSLAGVNVGQHQHVGLIERAAEIVPKMLGARVAVRLEEHQQAVDSRSRARLPAWREFRRDGGRSRRSA